MKKPIHFWLAAILLPAAVLPGCRKEEQKTTAEQKVIIGYVPGFRGALDETTIDPLKITHINYAFVNVQDSMAQLTNLATDTINFRKLNTLKRQNPDLKILISLGGWSWSDYFSDAVLTSSSRAQFTASNIDIVDTYGLDGVDIDWEYPGLRGEDNVFRPEDKENFTRMFASLRKGLDSLGRLRGKTYLLTTAVPCFTEFLNKTEMGKASAYLDYINVMAYDFFVNGDTAGHHSNLYPSASYEKESSAHRGVRDFIAAGVPAEKLVLGIPFYGRSWIMKTTAGRGINMPVDSLSRGGGYTYLKDTLMKKPGLVRYWDEPAKAPYLFDSLTRQLVTYDDEESVTEKCRYVKDNNLAGVMFWQYASDPREYLLTAINKALKD